MLGFFKKTAECELYSPVRGRQIALEETADPVFAKKLIGEGAAFIPEGDTWCAPCDGEVILVVGTRHALGIRAENGMEILLHVGMDTVNLNGEGFQVLVDKHAKVKAHQPLIRVDRNFMQERGIDLTTPVVVTNGQEYEIVIQENSDPVDTDNIIMHARRKKKVKGHESDKKYQ